MTAPHGDDRMEGSPGEVLGAFFKLGVTAFGGPIAHLGYFRDEFVTRRRWLGEADYADLVALCQFLPGPASSQVGFALGWLRAGLFGALAAFLAFTLPSAILMVAFAYGVGALGGPVGEGVIVGLKIVAVAIVAQAVWGMAKGLTPDRPRAAIAVGAIVLVAFVGGSLGQIAAIVFGAMAGMILCRDLPAPGAPTLVFAVPRVVGTVMLALFAVLLVGLPLLAAVWPAQAILLFDGFYRAGALVFGGGHVVLPLLEAETVARGWLGPDAFLAGYGAAQAMPGPLFTFAAYLGAALGPEPNGVVGAAIALVAVFLPGFLLLIGVLPFWQAMRSRHGARAAMAGTNAAVVGILAAALYDPVFTSTVTSPQAFALAALGVVLLVVFRIAPWIVVAVSALGGVGLALL